MLHPPPQAISKVNKRSVASPISSPFRGFCSVLSAMLSILVLKHCRKRPTIHSPHLLPIILIPCHAQREEQEEEEEGDLAQSPKKVGRSRHSKQTWLMRTGFSDFSPFFLCQRIIQINRICTSSDPFILPFCYNDTGLSQKKTNFRLTCNSCDRRPDPSET